jgi:type II secretory pathway component PulF
MKRIQTYFAGVLALISALVLAVVFYLAFIFPKTVAVWADEGRALSVVQTTLVNLSDVCKSFGLLVIPVLLLILIGCSIWAVVAGMAMKRKTANKALDDTSL